jgi:hypothetical protein
MSDIKAAIASVTKSVTKDWKKAKRQADRNDRVSSSRIQRLRYKPPRMTIREVAFAVMEDAYNKASSNGKYYANARQIMYAARPSILAQCDASEFNDVYFTQTLLKDYIEEFCPDWKVVWDARGHLIEPHTNEKVSLGGAGVEAYMLKWHADITRETPDVDTRIDTKGPGNRFRNVLFIEKEGFTEILMHAGIGSRYDMAIMSTKGLPVKAACDLIEALDEKDVRVFVLHDFDLAGFKIVRTLKRGTRLANGSPVIDLGLRMADIDGLSSESVSYKQNVNPVVYLEDGCGVTKEEARFLVSGGSHFGWRGERVEINAMTSDQMITWLERKFAEQGVTKIIPGADALAEAYKRAVFLQRLERKIEELEDEMHDDEFDVPDELAAGVKRMLEENPRTSWDDAVWELAAGADE